METVIADLVARFDAGTLSRRRLLQGLTALAAAGGVAPAAAQETPFKSTRIDHISVQTPDLAKSTEFYRTIFGLNVINEDKPNEIVRMGTTKIIVSLHHKEPFGIVDHFAIAIDDFNRDPAGVPVQIVGT